MVRGSQCRRIDPALLASRRQARTACSRRRVPYGSVARRRRMPCSGHVLCWAIGHPCQLDAPASAAGCAVVPTAHPPSAAASATRAGGIHPDGTHAWFERVSMKPRAIVAHNFASKEETDHIIELAKPLVGWAGPRGRGARATRGAAAGIPARRRPAQSMPLRPCAPAPPQLKRSTVVGAGGESVVDTYRTSYGMFIK